MDGAYSRLVLLVLLVLLFFFSLGGGGGGGGGGEVGAHFTIWGLYSGNEKVAKKSQKNPQSRTG